MAQDRRGNREGQCQKKPNTGSSERETRAETWSELGRTRKRSTQRRIHTSGEKRQRDTDRDGQRQRVERKGEEAEARKK